MHGYKSKAEDAIIRTVCLYPTWLPARPAFTCEDDKLRAHMSNSASCGAAFTGNRLTQQWRFPVTGKLSISHPISTQLRVSVSASTVTARIARRPVRVRFSVPRHYHFVLSYKFPPWSLGGPSLHSFLVPLGVDCQGCDTAMPRSALVHGVSAVLWLGDKVRCWAVRGAKQGCVGEPDTECMNYLTVNL